MRPRVGPRQPRLGRAGVVRDRPAGELERLGQLGVRVGLTPVAVDDAVRVGRREAGQGLGVAGSISTACSKAAAARRSPSGVRRSSQ